MSSLTLRVAAPLQSWGSAEGGLFKRTADVPTKSGVYGLLSNAAGYDYRDGSMMWNDLSMSVRVDRTGDVITDFHTSWAVQGGEKVNKGNVITYRSYLSGAAFLVVLEGPNALVDKAFAALRSPARPLFLGRKSCPPSIPLVGSDAVREEDSETVLKTCPWILHTLAGLNGSVYHKTDSRKDEKHINLDVLKDTSPSTTGAIVVRDVPLDVTQRRFGSRFVVRETVVIENPFYSENESSTLHDPMKGLG